MGSAFERAYLWCLAWNRLCTKLLCHVASLDPNTDELAILANVSRWQRARARRELARERMEEELARELGCELNRLARVLVRPPHGLPN